MNFGTGWIGYVTSARKHESLRASGGWNRKIRGDIRALGRGLIEMRIDFGPGYRVYWVRRGRSIILLLCGGDKRSQQRDITKARALIEELNG